MTEAMKKVSELRHRISMIYMQDHLSSEDYKDIVELEHQIKQIKIDEHGVALKLVHAGPQYSKNPFYLTDDEILSCGDEPTWFENEDELMAQFRKTSLYKNKSDYILEVIKK